MRNVFFCLFLLFFLTPLLAQDHILVDCVHGVSYTTTYMGPNPISFQNVFPNSTITMMDAAILPGITYLVNQWETGNQTLSYTVNMPATPLPQTLNTLYVIAQPDADSQLISLTGTITNPEGTIVESLCRGCGHVSGAYGNNWQIVIQNNSTDAIRVRIGYGPTLFSTNEYQGMYNLADYDAVIRLYDESYIPFIGAPPSYSVSDMTAMQQAMENGLALMDVYNLTNTLIDKPFVHFTARTDMQTSFSVHIPGKRTLAIPEPEMIGNNLLWKNLNLKTDKTTELLYEFALDGKLDWLDFTITGNQVQCKNRISYPLYDLILIKSTAPGMYEIAECPQIDANQDFIFRQGNRYTVNQARHYVLQALYQQCRKQGLSENEAHHFIYELPWVDTILLRANQRPEHYFAFYRFDSSIYDKLIPVQMEPAPYMKMRNMWVMLSDITFGIALTPKQLPDVSQPITNEQLSSYSCNEYGLADEHYTRQETLPMLRYFGLEVHESHMSLPDFYYAQNPFANVIASQAPTLPSVYAWFDFIPDSLSSFPVFYDSNYPRFPVSAAKLVFSQGRYMVLGTSNHFMLPEQFPFLQAAITALIHQPGLLVENEETPGPSHQEAYITNAPNPFNPQTNFFYYLPKDGKVKIELFNLKGQKVKTLLFQDQQAGKHSLAWNGMNDMNLQVSSQILLCRMHYNGKNYVRKIVLLK